MCAAIRRLGTPNYQHDIQQSSVFLVLMFICPVFAALALFFIVMQYACGSPTGQTTMPNCDILLPLSPKCTDMSFMTHHLIQSAVLSFMMLLNTCMSLWIHNCHQSISPPVIIASIFRVAVFPFIEHRKSQELYIIYPVRGKILQGFYPI